MKGERRPPGWLAMLAVLAVLPAAACGEGAGPVRVTTPAAALPDSVAVAIVEHADDVLRDAAAGRPAELESVLGGRLLAVESRRAEVRRARQAWLVSTLLDRRAVHVAAARSAPEVVLMIRVRSGAATDARQWRATLGRPGGRWVVVEAADLPPSQWWPTP